jgi:hypothetical protein
MQHQKKGWLLIKKSGSQVQSFYCPNISLDSLRKTKEILRHDIKTLPKGYEETIEVLIRNPGRD